MPAKVTLPAMLIASLLAVAAPVLAETPPSQPSTTAPVPSDEAADTTVAVGEITDTTLDVDGPLNTTVTGPASVPGAVPTRGPQVQLATPPPSPFDPPADGGFGRRVVYSKSQQTVWAYDETNTIIKMHRVSGRQDPRDPLPGTYRVWSRSSRTFSINNPTITWNYMVRFAKGDRDGNIGFHDIPYQYGQPVQTIDQLGQALSGGCVRQAPEDAIWMWNWAQLGTVVVVTP